LTGDKVTVLDAANEFESEATARITVGKLATLASASVLAATAPPAVAEAFLRTRVSKPHRALYGASGIDNRTADLILQRALPES